MPPPHNGYVNEIVWESIYQDADGNLESLWKYDFDEQGNLTDCPYTDIDRDRLTHFRLWRNGEAVLTLFLDPGQRLIWRRRTELTSAGGRTVTHICGWQMTVKGENVQSISYINEANGQVVWAGKWRPETGLMYEVNVQEHERER